jgi:ABC-type lipoprotein release transport system permease subunit
VWARARWEFGSDSRAWVVLVVLIALAAGAAMAAAAGAMRAESAYPRFLSAQRGYDVATGGIAGNVDPEAARARIVQLPQIAEWSRLDLVAAQAVLPSGRIATAPELVTVTDLQGRTGFAMNRFKVVAGRVFDPRSPGEAVTDFSTADRLGLHVGSTVRLILEDVTDQHPRSAPLRIVGVVATPGGFPAIGVSNFGYLYASPAVVGHFDLRPSASEAGMLLRLREGRRDVPGFLRDLRDAGLGGVDITVESDQTFGVQRSIRYEVLALWALAGLVAVTAFAALGQSLARQVFLDSAEHPILRAIGMSHTQLFALGIFRVGAVAAAGAALAVPTAWLLSPLTPIGLARIAEPTPGFAADPRVWVVGALVTVVGFSAAGSVPAWRAARAADRVPSAVIVTGERPSAVAAALARISPSPAASVGVRMALQTGRGQAAVPVRSAALGCTVAVAALVASIVFGASLGRLANTPRLSGLTWDVFVAGADESQGEGARVAAALRRDPDVDSVGRGGWDSVEIAGRSPFAFFVEGDPSLRSPIAHGRAPVGDDEIALGPETMRLAHARIGGTVDVAYVGPDTVNRVVMRVVGQAVTPPAPWVGTYRPGEGVTFTIGGYRRVVAGPVRSLPFLVRFRAGVDPDAATGRLQRRLPEALLLPSRQPSQVAAIGGIAKIPVVLSGLLGALAAGALSHTLLTSIRRRRREFAILKTVGFVRRQVAGVVAWQATTFAAWATLVGVPVGIAVGRWTWRALADQVGVDPSIAYPLIIPAIVPAAVVFANVLALGPAHLAVHTPVARVLRSE